MDHSDTEIHSKSGTLNDIQAYQNESNNQRQLEQLEEASLHCKNLYDNALVGFLTLNQAGDILAINQTGAKMLGMSYPFIINKPFSNYIHQDDKHVFFDHLQQTFTSFSNTVTELRIKNPLAKTKIKHTLMESLVIKSAGTCCILMTDINQLKVATHPNQELLHENRQLMQSLFKVQEKERHLLAHELHDELGQWLTAIYLGSETILNNTQKESVIGISALDIIECVKKMHEVIRGMLYQLRPALLDALGLVDALLEFKKHWCLHHPNITLELKFNGKLKTLDENINITVFRIIQEALNNILNHAQATQARIHLSRDVDKNDTLTLDVADNGKGYDPNQTSKGLGLLGMRERAIAAGGKFSIQGMPNNGTQIQVKLPLDNNGNGNGNGNKRRKTDDL